MNIFKKLITTCCFALVFASCAYASPDWYEAYPAFRIAGNLYYVGTRGLASYLVVTDKGNILINSDYEANVPMIKQSIESLGFKYQDTKIILISQAHSDHAAASALIKKQTGAKYFVMSGDVAVVESGGKKDYLFGSEPEQWYPPVKVDHTLHDGEQVKLGNTTLVAHLTPGHTKGCTTWTMQVNENGKTYQAVIVGGVSINPGTKFVDNKAYPTIVDDFEKMWRVSKALSADIFLGAHGIYFDLEKKYARLQNGDKTAFVDSQGYKDFIAKKEQDFRDELAKQRAS